MDSQDNAGNTALHHAAILDANEPLDATVVALKDEEPSEKWAQMVAAILEAEKPLDLQLRRRRDKYITKEREKEGFSP